MIERFCINCGNGEDNGISVIEHGGHSSPQIDQMSRECIGTTFYCPHCDIEEEVDTGVLATKETEWFDLRESCSKSKLTVEIDGTDIQFIDIDEQMSTSIYYTTGGVRNTSQVHNIHIHTINPPTISKGPHHLKIGSYIDKEMTLSRIRYCDNKHRTFMFHQTIDEQDKIRETSSTQKAKL